MLKIKDNIDLKVLEKYGFEYFQGKTSKIYGIDLGNDDDCVSVVVNCYNKHIWATHEGITRDVSDEFLTFMYVLIQAGIVEKVEG